MSFERSAAGRTEVGPVQTIAVGPVETIVPKRGMLSRRGSNPDRR
jgi:hypothetical protein